MLDDLMTQEHARHDQHKMSTVLSYDW